MILLNPKMKKYEYLDEKSRKIMLKTIEFFETRGKKSLRKMIMSGCGIMILLNLLKRKKFFQLL